MRELLFWVAFLSVFYHIFCASYLWSAWSTWPLACSKTCGEGERCRTRKCQDGFGKSANETYCLGDSRDCITCMVSSKCPQMPGWSDWSEWGECILSDPRKDVKPDKSGCRPGTKMRYRLCNNPPPEPGPNAPICLGPSQEATPCKFGCPDVPNLNESDIHFQIEQRVISDHLVTRVLRKNPIKYADGVFIRAPGDNVVLSCLTDSYSFADELLTARSEGIIDSRLPKRKFELFWLLGGRVIASENEGIRMRDARLVSSDEKLEEVEKQYLSQLERTQPVIKGTQLLLNNIGIDDTGFYSCHARLGKYEWMVIFYSLIVIGQQISAPNQMPLYLHSNIGARNPFRRGNIHWYDAARLQWMHNGEIKFTNLVARPRARIQLIPKLNREFQGRWECFLIVPIPDTPTTLGSWNFTPSGRFLINSFFLRVTESSHSLWELGDLTIEISLLRYISVTALTAICLLIILIILTFWAVRRWVKRTPSKNQLDGLVERIVEDRTYLFIDAGKEVNKRKQLLVPYVRQENREIEMTRWNAEHISTEETTSQLTESEERPKKKIWKRVIF